MLLEPCNCACVSPGRVWPPHPMAPRCGARACAPKVPQVAHARSSAEALHAGSGVSRRCGGVAVGMEWLVFLALLLTVAGRLRARHADSSQCTLGNFHCDNGDQVLLCLRCDGEPACTDGSDEADCYSGNVSCGPRGRQCGHGGRCLPFERFCDGQQDCPDSSDESARACGFRATGPPVPPPCQKEEFRCAPDAACYPVAWVCDGHPDCPDARDELGCPLDFRSTTKRVPAMPWTESTESPEVLKMERSVIVAIVALLISVVAGAAVSVWVRLRAKPLLVQFSLKKASEQLMTKDQP